MEHRPRLETLLSVRYRRSHCSVRRFEGANRHDQLWYVPRWPAQSQRPKEALKKFNHRLVRILASWWNSIGHRERTWERCDIGSGLSPGVSGEEEGRLVWNKSYRCFIRKRELWRIITVCGRIRDAHNVHRKYYFEQSWSNSLIDDFTWPKCKSSLTKNNFSAE